MKRILANEIICCRAGWWWGSRTLQIVFLTTPGLVGEHKYFQKLDLHFLPEGCDCLDKTSYFGRRMELFAKDAESNVHLKLQIV